MRYETGRDALERACEAEFFCAGGPGGQHKNKTQTAVRLRHPAAGLTVTAAEERSRPRNLARAFERMAERLAALNHTPKRRIATRTPRRAVARRLENKARRGELKRGRAPLG